MWCCKQTLTFPVRFSQHGDGRGAVNRPLPFPSGSPSMEMDVVLLTDPYLSRQVLPAWRWMWCCKQTLTFPIRFSQHGDGRSATNRPLPFPSGSPSMEMDAVLQTDPYLSRRVLPAWRWTWCCCGSSRISPFVRTRRS